MKWEAEAIILNVGKFSERDAVVTLFARGEGLYRAVVKGAFSKKQRGVWQVGNMVYAHWNARLEEHMGTMYGELSAAYAAWAMDSREALTAIASSCSLLSNSLMERDPHPALYDALSDVLEAFATNHESRWVLYGFYELLLLTDAGFGLDVTCCASTGEVENLIYISPKSGRAVSAEAGKPYHDRLLPLPPCVLTWMREGDKPQKTVFNAAETLDLLRLTGYFMSHWLFEQRKGNVPQERVRLVELFAKAYENECNTAREVAVA